MPDLEFTLTPASAEHWRELIDDDRRARRRPAPVRHHQRLGRPASDGRAGRRPHPQRPGRTGSARATRSCSSPRAASRRRSPGRASSPASKNVVVNGGQMATQALQAGLLEEIGVDLVPVLLGRRHAVLRPARRRRSTSRARSRSSRAKPSPTCATGSPASSGERAGVGRARRRRCRRPAAGRCRRRSARRSRRVIRPTSGCSIVLRSATWRATRALLPELLEARAGRAAGRRSARCSGSSFG